VLAHALIDLDPRYPRVDADRKKDLAQVKAMLEAEAPRGAAADPFVAEMAAEDGQESKAARRQREQVRKAREKLAQA